MSIDFNRSDLADALLDVPPRHAQTFRDYVTACAFNPDVHTPGSEHAQTVIAGALAKVRAAQGTPDKPDVADTRTPDQIVREAVEKRHGPQKSYITLQRLMSAMRDELYPESLDPMRHTNANAKIVKRDTARDPSAPRDPMRDLIAANAKLGTTATGALLRELDNAKRAFASHKGTEIGRIAEGRMYTLRAQIVARGVTPPP